VLIGKIAASLNITTTEVYRECIRNIGDNFEVMQVRSEAVGKWTEIWRSHGLGWICEDLGRGAAEGYREVICYYGSRTYDSKQMSNLIGLLVADCKEIGIEHLPPHELERLIGEWAG